MNQRFSRVFAKPQICKPKLDVYQARINYLYLYLVPVPVPSFVLPRVPRTFVEPAVTRRNLKPAHLGQREKPLSVPVSFTCKKRRLFTIIHDVFAGYDEGCAGADVENVSRTGPSSYVSVSETCRGWRRSAMRECPVDV